MGINLETFYLYQLKNDKYLLLKVNRPGFNNSIQSQADKADEILESKQEFLLKSYLKKNLTTLVKYIGYFQGLPEGDILYEKKGKLNLTNLWFVKTSYNENSIFLSLATDEKTFWKITNEEDFADNGMEKENLFKPAYNIKLFDFITENDFDLSVIPDAYTIDLEEKRLSNNRI